MFQSAEPPDKSTRLPQNARALAGFFAAEGCVPAEKPPVLQPVELFLDHANRDLRRQFYMLRDIEGRHFFLRPDFTLPLACAYAAQARPQAGKFCYDGPVFRFDAARDALIRRPQAGIEFFGASEDHEVVLLAAKAVHLAGLAGAGKVRLVLGDAGLFTALTQALEIPAYWQRHLQARFRRRMPGRPAPALALPGAGRFARLPQSPETLQAWWKKQGITPIGARSTYEIATRLTALAALARPATLHKEEAALVKRFLSVDAPPLQALERIATLARKAGIDLDARLNHLAHYFGALAAGGIDIDRARFATGFAGSDVGYYNGFLFSVYGAGRAPLAAGGRYDGLLAALGAKGEAARGAGAAIYLKADRSQPKSAQVKRQTPAFMPQDHLLVGLPSKGRIGESASQWLGQGKKTGRLDLAAVKNNRQLSLTRQNGEVEIIFLPAAEIAHQLVQGQLHLGITGMDLMRERAPSAGRRNSLTALAALPFSHARLTLAVPQCWVDVETMSDFDEMATAFVRLHGRRLRIATKYPRLARAFFSEKGLIAYRLVESLGATESAPAQMTAEAVLDITSSGHSLKANGLKVLKNEKGGMLTILSSQAGIFASAAAPWRAEVRAAAEKFLHRLGVRGAAGKLPPGKKTAKKPGKK